MYLSQMLTWPLLFMACLTQSSMPSFQPRLGQWFPIYKYSSEGQWIIRKALEEFERQKDLKILQYAVNYIHSQPTNGMNYMISLTLEECRKNKFQTAVRRNCETLACLFEIYDSALARIYDLKATCQKKRN